MDPTVAVPSPTAGISAELRTDDLATGLGSRTARGGIVTIVSQAIKFVLTMASTVVLARLLSPDDYGLVGMVAVVTGFVMIFKDLGLSSATIQRSDLNEGQVNTLFWVNVGASTLTAVLTAALAPLVARFYGRPELTPITMAYAVGFIFAGLTVQHEALLRRRMRFGALATAEILSLAFGIAAGISLASQGARYWALVGGQLTQGVCYMIAVWVSCRWRPGRPRRNTGARPMLAFGRDLTGFSITNYFARNLDNMLIGRKWGGEQLGFYARAYQLLMLPIDQTNSPLTAVALPALSRLTNAPDRYRSAYLRLIEKVALLTMPFMAVMIVTSDWVVALLLGPKWAAVSRLFQLLAIAGFAQPICSTTGWLFVSQGRGRDLFRWGLIGPSITVASILVGLPWGATGVALAYSVTFLLLVAPTLFWFVGRSGPVQASHLYRAVGPIFTASLCGLAAGSVARLLTGITQPVLGIVACGAITTGTVLAVLIAMPAGRRGLVDLRDTAIPLLRSPRRLVA